MYTLIVLDVWCPDLTTDEGVAWYRYKLGRDLPWVLADDRWRVESWGLRGRGGESRDPRLRARGPVIPRALPTPLALSLAWLVHMVLALGWRGRSVAVAPTPYSAAGATVAGTLRQGPPVVVRVIGNAPSKLGRVSSRQRQAAALARAERWALRRADLVVPMGGFTRSLAESAGVPAARIVVLPFPTSWRALIASDDEKDPHPLCVCAARLVPEKGIDVLLQAWARVAERLPDARLEVAGDGPARADLERLARRLGVDGRVRFRGWVPADEMPTFYGRAWVAVLPSRVEEGLGMCLVEAGLAGCALVGSDLGGITDIVWPGTTGLLVPPDDAHALAQALASLLADRRRAAALGAAAREAARGYLDKRDAALAELRRRVEALAARG